MVNVVSNKCSLGVSMNNEQLIEYVREYQFLYDPNNKHYSDNQKKEIAWREIARRLDVHERECKKAWTLLRDSFRRSIKKQIELKSENENITYKKWKYEDEMAFLLPYFKIRSNLYIPATQDEDQNECSVSLLDECSISTAEQQQEEIIPDNNPYNYIAATTSAQETIQPTKRQRKAASKAPTSEETILTTLMNYVVDCKKETDDIAQFFASIATTVKTFPVRERAIAKAKVFELISKMEIDLLSSPISSSNE